MIKVYIQMQYMVLPPCFYVFWKRRNRHIFWWLLMQGKQLFATLHLRIIKVEDKKHLPNYQSSFPFLRIYLIAFKSHIINWINMKQMISLVLWLLHGKQKNRKSLLFPETKTFCSLSMITYLSM